MSYMCLRDKLVAGAKADQLSAAVVFLPQNTLHFGKHGKECFCVAMYGKVRLFLSSSRALKFSTSSFSGPTVGVSLV